MVDGCILLLLKLMMWTKLPKGRQMIFKHCLAWRLINVIPRYNLADGLKLLCSEK